MLMTVFDSFWDDLLDPLKITFDGPNKLIYINPQYSVVSVKIDLYSASKRWLQRRQNLSYLPPLRSVGGDIVNSTTGLYAGDIYFLTNDWQIVIDHTVAATGILYQDNPALQTYIVQSGGGITAAVSNLAYAYNTTGVTVPTASDIATAVLGSNPAPYTGTTTVGGKIYDTKTATDDIKDLGQNIIAITA